VTRPYKITPLYWRLEGTAPSILPIGTSHNCMRRKLNLQKRNGATSASFRSPRILGCLRVAHPLHNDNIG
jgi:hypothetical protein